MCCRRRCCSVRRVSLPEHPRNAILPACSLACVRNRCGLPQQACPPAWSRWNISAATARSRRAWGKKALCCAQRGRRWLRPARISISPGLRATSTGLMRRLGVASGEQDCIGRRRTMDRRGFVIGSTVLAAGTLAAPAVMRAATEVSFYYPIAVGGPITKIIDGYAAAFEKENPGITVKPIYAGTYQETIVKALTGHKAGTPPVVSVLLSTDMFSLIDEEAIVPFDEFASGEADKAWIESFFPPSPDENSSNGK